MTLAPMGVSVDIQHYLLPGLGFTVLAGCGLVAIIANRLRAPLEARLLPLVGLAAGPGLLYALSLPVAGPYSPRIEERYLLVFLPLYAIALAAGFAYLLRRSRPLAGIAAVLATVVLAGQLGAYYAERYMVYDIAALGQFVSAYARPGDAVVLNPDRDYPVYAAYLGADVNLTTIPFAERLSDDRAETLLAPTAGAPTVWLIETRDVGIDDPKQTIRENLSGRLRLLAEIGYGDSKLTVYSQVPPAVVFAGAPAGAGTAAPAGAGGEAIDWGVAPARLIAGSNVYAWERWLPDRAGAPLQAHLNLRSLFDGQTYASSDAPLDPAPLAGQSQIVFAQQSLGVPCTATRGDYAVFLDLPLAGGDVKSLRLGTVSVAGRPAVDEAAGAREPIDVQFAGGIRLVGFKLDKQSLRPGEPLALNLYWSASESHRELYGVSVEVVDAENHVVAEYDGTAGGDACPSTAWGLGEVVGARYAVPLPADLAAGSYRIVAALHSAFNGPRLPVLSPQPDLTPEGTAQVATFTIDK